MVKQQYELAMLSRGTLAEGAEKKLLDTTTKLLESIDAIIVDTQTWNKRPLAYEISKETDGYYSFLRFTAAGDRLRDVTSKLQVNDGVLRFFILKYKEPKKKKSDKKDKIQTK